MEYIFEFMFAMSIVKFRKTYLIRTNKKKDSNFVEDYNYGNTKYAIR